jgi:hypothetical protein
LISRQIENLSCQKNSKVKIPPPKKAPLIPKYQNTKIFIKVSHNILYQFYYPLFTTLPFCTKKTSKTSKTSKTQKTRENGIIFPIPRPPS